MSRSAPNRTIEIIPRSYQDEEFCTSRTSLIRKHSIELLVYRFSRTWRVRFTLQAQWPRSTPKLRRKKAIEAICRQIDFNRLQLLRNTVTEIGITCELDIAAIHPLPLAIDTAKTDVLISGTWYFIREDPSRIRYPPYRDLGTPIEHLSSVTKEKELGAGVHLARRVRNNELCVYKEVDRPLYAPCDTDILEQELTNLKLLKGTKHVVQLLAVVVSRNPYRTDDADGENSPVLRGILLEYHPNGSLASILRSPGSGLPYLVWARQIALALHELHSQGLAHMDIKPSNIVISARHDAVLIDVSGRAITQEWLSPEMCHFMNPCLQDMNAKVRNDVWAYGKLLSVFQSASNNPTDKELLGRISLQIKSSSCVSLREILHQLQGQL